MLKLLSVDAPGERALRVVAYFDQLGANRPDLDAIVRATALIADCTAGLELRDRGLLLRYSPEGGQLTGAGTPTEQVAFSTDSGEHGSVWLERQGAPLELDEFIVERFALTAALVVARARPSGDLESAHGFADPALAQLLVNERASMPTLMVRRNRRASQTWPTTAAARPSRATTTKTHPTHTLIRSVARSALVLTVTRSRKG